MWLRLDITAETIIKNPANNKVTTLNIKHPMPVGYEQWSFDLCLDKGTYDAVSLCPDDSQKKRLEYIESLKRLLCDSGLFIIVSCNWTCKELKCHFKDFIFLEEIPAPSFTFGGKQGQTVSTCVFKLAKDHS